MIYIINNMRKYKNRKSPLNRSASNKSQILIFWNWIILIFCPVFLCLQFILNQGSNQPQLMSSVASVKKQRKYSSFLRLFGITANCGLSAFYFGYCITYFNAISFKDIVGIYSIEFLNAPVTEGLITASINFTGAFGSIIAMYLTNAKTYRQALCFIAFLTSILSLVILYPNIWVLVTVRLLQGLLIGMISCITALYINQMIPKQVTASFWSFHQFLFMFGIAFSFILSAICAPRFPPEIYWRIVFGFPIVTSVIQVFNFLYVFNYQSPKYLIMTHQHEKARQVINLLYKQKFRQKMFQQIVQAVKYVQQDKQDYDINALDAPLMTPNQLKAIQLQPILNKSNVKFDNKLQLSSPSIKGQQSMEQTMLNAELKRQKQQLKDKNKANGQQKRALNNRLTVILAVYMTVQQAFMGGPSVINFPGELIRGVFPDLRNSFPMIINVAGIFAALFAICILNKIGRRKIIIFATFSEAICLTTSFVLLYFIDYTDPTKAPHQMRVLMVVLLFLIRIILALTYTPVVDIYVAEIIQGDATSWCTFLSWISGSISMSLFPILCSYKQGRNPFYAFGVYSVVTTISAFINYRYVLETKSKSQIQIRKQFDQKFPDKKKV